MALNVVSVVDASCVVEEIRAYRQDVTHGRVRPGWSQCPQCQCDSRDGEGFGRHDARDRWFWVVVGGLVERVRSLITRWKCAQCQGTSTLYPRFALPHKRYVLTEVWPRAQRYVQDDDLSYRQGVTTNARAVFHDRGEDQDITPESTEEDRVQEPVPALAHTTLHRWVTTLGQLPNTVRQAGEWIRQRQPGTRLFRELAQVRISPRKYRSEARHRVLQACRSLGLTEAGYTSIFGVSLFPHLATTCGWT